MLIVPRRSTVLRETIVRLLDHPSLYAALGERSQEKAVRGFSYDRYFAAIRKVAQRLLKEESGV